MRRSLFIAVGVLSALSLQATAEEQVICTIAKEINSSQLLLHEGDCDERMSAASTFKIAISLMAYDSGILTASDQPEWQYQEGYPDWSPLWREPTTPARWMRLSVVWFSQQITTKLGEERFASYVNGFGYGNRDITGEQDKSNGLTHAWLSSSLQISPVEQVGFLTRMIEGDLPVEPMAVEETRNLLAFDGQPNGWRVFGKTGAGMPPGEDGTLLKGQPFGWYVGWAEKGSRKVVFARLVRFSERPETTPAMLARQGLIDRLFGESGPLG